MDQEKRVPAWIGTTCTWVGAAIGVFAITAMAVGLKATFTPDMRTVEIFRGVLGPASLVAFGISAGLMITGAVLGRRRKEQLAAEQNRLLTGEYAGRGFNVGQPPENAYDRARSDDLDT